MGTRMLSESLVRQQFPHLPYIRIRTTKPHAATIYAWDEQLSLSSADLAAVRRFAADYLTPHVCFHIQPYSRTLDDQVTPAQPVPPCIAEAAMERSLDSDRIFALLGEMLPQGDIAFIGYNPISAIVRLSVHTEAPVLPIERELLSRYLQELLPLGSFAEVQYTVDG